MTIRIVIIDRVIDIDIKLPDSLVHLLLLIKVSIAFALHVNATALVAEFKTASAGHVVTTFVFADPELTVGALLKLRPVNESKEKFIIEIWILINLILSTALIHVESGATLKAVSYITLKASVVIFILIRDVNKGICAIRCRAP
jgi:hypothetical protein